MSGDANAAIKQLLATEILPALGAEPRTGRLAEKALHTRLDELFANTELSASQRELIRAVLLLWHDHLDASHTISQRLENQDGSFVHAIMHRREPDYWNAKYWWRRVGAHPSFPEISRRVKELLSDSRRGEEADLAKQLLPGGKWDAGAFVDACEAAMGDSECESLLREIQRIETEVLLEYLLAR